MVNATLLTLGAAVESSLVTLQVTAEGVAIVELNDAAHYNAQSHVLMTSLLHQLCVVRRMAEQGLVKCMVLQGVGPHFCTGGWNPGDATVAPLSMCDFALTKYIAAQIRALPIPSLAAIHGKLIGGGLALALATD